MAELSIGIHLSICLLGRPAHQAAARRQIRKCGSLHRIGRGPEWQSGSTRSLDRGGRGGLPAGHGHRPPGARREGFVYRQRRRSDRVQGSDSSRSFCGLRSSTMSLGKTARHYDFLQLSGENPAHHRTTNRFEAYHPHLLKVTKTKSSFPTPEAA